MKNTLTIILSSFCLIFLFAVASNAQQKVNVTKKKADQPVKIIFKPVVEFGRCKEATGRVLLRVTFDKTAKITEAKIVESSGCDEFDNNALKAARAIKFKPAIKDGEEITLSKPVEYTFRTY